MAKIEISIIYCIKVIKPKRQTPTDWPKLVFRKKVSNYTYLTMASKVASRRMQEAKVTKIQIKAMAESRAKEADNKMYYKDRK